MKRSDRWVFREGYEPQYQFRGSSVMETDGLHDHSTEEFNSLNGFFAFLEDDTVKTTFSKAANISLEGPFTGFVSLLLPGDGTAPHTDVAVTEPGQDPEFPGGYRRAVGFALHMSKDWNPAWGGDLVWANPMTHVSPRFNSLTIFPSHHQAWHFIQPVVPHAPSFESGGPRRMSISGWFTTTDHDAGKARENDLAIGVCERSNNCRRSYIDGESGAIHDLKKTRDNSRSVYSDQVDPWTQDSEMARAQGEAEQARMQWLERNPRDRWGMPVTAKGGGDAVALQKAKDRIAELEAQVKKLTGSNRRQQHAIKIVPEAQELHAQGVLLRGRLVPGVQAVSRPVGLVQRQVPLRPGQEEKQEEDGEGVTARMRQLQRQILPEAQELHAQGVLLRGRLVPGVQAVSRPVGLVQRQVSLRPGQEEKQEEDEEREGE